MAGINANSFTVSYLIVTDIKTFYELWRWDLERLIFLKHTIRMWQKIQIYSTDNPPIYHTILPFNPLTVCTYVSV